MQKKRSQQIPRSHLALLAIFCVVLLWSLYQPYDYFIWFLEALPALLSATILLIMYRWFPLSTRTYGWIVFACCLLMIGAHYTYEKNPFFTWLQTFLELERNHFDRFGHFFQGFVPAIVLREIILRLQAIKRGWQSVCIIAICLAASAIYELVEWWVALAYGERADKFLGFQGDFWDTQWDMFLALAGSALALLTTRAPHKVYK